MSFADGTSARAAPLNSAKRLNSLRQRLQQIKLEEYDSESSSLELAVKMGHLVSNLEDNIDDLLKQHNDTSINEDLKNLKPRNVNIIDSNSDYQAPNLSSNQSVGNINEESSSFDVPSVSVSEIPASFKDSESFKNSASSARGYSTTAGIGEVMSQLNELKAMLDGKNTLLNNAQSISTGTRSRYPRFVEQPLPYPLQRIQENTHPIKFVPEAIPAKIFDPYAKIHDGISDPHAFQAMSDRLAEVEAVQNTNLRKIALSYLTDMEKLREMMKNPDPQNSEAMRKLYERVQRRERRRSKDKREKEYEKKLKRFNVDGTKNFVSLDDLDTSNDISLREHARRRDKSILKHAEMKKKKYLERPLPHDFSLDTLSDIPRPPSPILSREESWSFDENSEEELDKKKSKRKSKRKNKKMKKINTLASDYATDHTKTISERRKSIRSVKAKNGKKMSFDGDVSRTVTQPGDALRMPSVSYDHSSEIYESKDSMMSFLGKRQEKLEKLAYYATIPPKPITLSNSSDTLLRDLAETSPEFKILSQWLRSMNIEISRALKLYNYESQQKLPVIEGPKSSISNFTPFTSSTLLDPCVEFLLYGDDVLNFNEFIHNGFPTRAQNKPLCFGKNVQDVVDMETVAMLDPSFWRIMVCLAPLEGISIVSERELYSSASHQKRFENGENGVKYGSKFVLFNGNAVVPAYVVEFLPIK
ncbi:hypothetical protein PCE1_001438 [Barthelona sp. PCE]